MSRLDKYRKAFDKSRKKEDARAQRKRHRTIAAEAARRLGAIVGEDTDGNLKRTPGATDFHSAKMQAVAVLGLSVRPGDLPPDSLVVEMYETRHEFSEPAEEDVVSPDDGEGALLTDPAAGKSYADRFDHYLAFLKPLENVKQNPKTHPEGDALYHSLQAFENVRKVNLYDEELLTAALLHDVGKAIDPTGDAHAASVKALQGKITDRTARLIEKLADAHSHRNGTLGFRARRALDHDEDFDALMLMAEADHNARAQGVDVPSAEEAIDYLRELAAEDET